MTRTSPPWRRPAGRDECDRSSCCGPQGLGPSAGHHLGCRDGRSRPGSSRRRTSTIPTPTTRARHTQADGSAQPKHLEDTAKSKAFARKYDKTFHLAGNRDHNDEFFTGDLMIRHEPGVRDGLREFLHEAGVLMQQRTIDDSPSSYGRVIWSLSPLMHKLKECQGREAMRNGLLFWKQQPGSLSRRE